MARHFGEVHLSWTDSVPGAGAWRPSRPRSTVDRSCRARRPVPTGGSSPHRGGTPAGWPTGRGAGPLRASGLGRAIKLARAAATEPRRLDMPGLVRAAAAFLADAAAKEPEADPLT